MQINISIIDIKSLNKLFIYILSLIYTKHMLVLKKHKKKKSCNNSALKISKIFKNLYFIYI